MVVLAVIIGAIGWYRYLTRPPRAVEIATSPAPPESAAETPPSPEPASATSAPTRADESGPLTLSAKELEEAIRSPDAQTRASLGDYTGREVVWSGTVVTAALVNELRRVELKDPDGIRIVAWCDAGREVSAGAAVSIHGFLASKVASGFVVERCTVL